MDRNYVAIHEAGHAVIGMLLGAKLDVVTIEPDEDRDSEGYARHHYGVPSEHIGGENWGLMVKAITALAGHAATTRLGHNETPEEAEAHLDYDDATTHLFSIARDTTPLMERALATTQLMVEMAWPSIRMVAALLMEAGTITEQEIREALDMTLEPDWEEID